MKKYFSNLCLAIFILSFSLSSTSLGDDQNSLWIGVMHKNGILAPAGVYSDGVWKNTWPEYSEGDPNIVEVIMDKSTRSPLPLEEVSTEWLSGDRAIPKTWHLWPGAGQPSSAITVDSLIEYPSHCDVKWGLKTSWAKNYKDSDNRWPRSKEGIALSLQTKVSQPFNITPPMKDSAGVVEFAWPRFNQEEKEAGYSNSTGNESALKILKVIKLDVAQSDQILYFVALSKEYMGPENPPGYPCNDISRYNAWVLHDKMGYKLIGSTVAIGDCDRSDIDWIEPLGLIVLDAKTYVMSVEYGYEWENYTIRLFDGNHIAVVLRTFGGGC